MPRLFRLEHVVVDEVRFVDILLEFVQLRFCSQTPFVSIVEESLGNSTHLSNLILNVRQVLLQYGLGYLFLDFQNHLKFCKFFF